MGSGLPSFTPDCSCPVLLKYQSWRSMRVSYPAVTVCGDAFQTSSDTHLIHQCDTAVSPDWASNPGGATPAGLTHHRFRLLPVRSPLLREYFLFLGVHEMFQFPRCPPDHWSGHRVTTMGLPHSEIVGSMPARGSPTLIAAMPRPSSARSAEASTLCSYCLPSRKTCCGSSRSLSIAWSFATTTPHPTPSALGKVQPRAVCRVSCAETEASSPVTRHRAHRCAFTPES